MDRLEPILQEAKKRAHPYAVFDMDFTLTVNDTEITTEYTQVMHHLFWMDPVTFRKGMSSYYPQGFSSFAKEAVECYETLASRKETDPTIRAAFQTAMFGVLHEVDNFPGLENCTFPNFLKMGLKREELSVFTSLMLRHLLKEPLQSSYQGMTYPSGLRPNQVIIDILHRLHQEGIGIAVVSASYETDVKAMIKALSLEKEVDHVCAVKDAFDDCGYVLPINGDSEGLLPWKEGKVAVIRRDLVPIFGEEPSFAFGDSNSDVPMLTSFPHLLLAGISPFANGEEMLELAKNSQDVYQKGKTLVHRF